MGRVSPRNLGAAGGDGQVADLVDDQQAVAAEDAEPFAQAAIAFGPAEGFDDLGQRDAADPLPGSHRLDAEVGCEMAPVSAGTITRKDAAVANLQNREFANSASGEKTSGTDTWQMDKLTPPHPHKLREPSFRPSHHLLNASAERWPSGRRHTPAKGAGGKPSRGFESLPLRHLPSRKRSLHPAAAGFFRCFRGLCG